MPYLAFARWRKRDGGNTNCSAQTQTQNLQSPGWGDEGRWRYRGEDGGRGSSHLSGVQGLCGASLARGKRCTQLNPSRETRLQGQRESAAWVLTSSARFTVAQRGPGGLWLDRVLGNTAFELAHSQFGSASSVTAPATRKHPLNWPREPREACGPTLQPSCRLPTPQPPLHPLSKETVICMMRPQPSCLHSNIVSAVTCNPLTRCVILKRGEHPPPSNQGTKTTSLHQFSAEILQV